MNILNKLFLSSIVVIFCFITIIGCNPEPDVPTPDIVGTFTWTEWQKKSGWKDHSASEYIPDSICLQALSTFINEFNVDVKFEIYASNWCHKDCEPQLPRMIKFLKAAGINESNIIIYGLNRNRTEPVEAMDKWKTNFPEETCYVPTLVIYSNNAIYGKIKFETIDYPEWQCEIPTILVGMETD
jgi:hypothetical protein